MEQVTCNECDELCTPEELTQWGICHDCENQGGYVPDAVLYLGGLCVWCLEDTSFGSGKYVNRIPVSTDSDSVEWLTEEQAEKYITVEGWGCAECGCYECDICSEPIATDTDIADKQELGHYHTWCLPLDKWHEETLEWFNSDVPESNRQLYLTKPTEERN
jgi:hypothetical protein